MKFALNVTFTAPIAVPAMTASHCVITADAVNYVPATFAMIATAVKNVSISVRHAAFVHSAPAQTCATFVTETAATAF